jgi:ribosomal protein S9
MYPESLPGGLPGKRKAASSRSTLKAGGQGNVPVATINLEYIL